jgi:hypothetical protein
MNKSQELTYNIFEAELGTLPEELCDTLNSTDFIEYAGITRRTFEILDLTRAKYAQKETMRRATIFGTWLYLVDRAMETEAPEYCYGIAFG